MENKSHLCMVGNWYSCYNWFIYNFVWLQSSINFTLLEYMLNLCPKRHDKQIEIFVISLLDHDVMAQYDLKFKTWPI